LRREAAGIGFVGTGLSPGAIPTVDFLLSHFCKIAKNIPVKIHVGAISLRTPSRPKR
jgi:hypothetical protein